VYYEKGIEMATKQNRDYIMSVKLTADMRDKLAFVADALGQAPATVASIAVGQFVAAQFSSLNASSKTGEVLSGVLTDFFKTLTESDPSCSSSKDSSAQLPLLVAEPTKKPAKSSRFGTSSKSKPSTVVDSSK
jgi:hypothetical protein